jgi:signal recognition particle GTPase
MVRQNDGEKITLKEYVEQRLLGIDSKTKLQIEELAQHVEDLNHSQQRAIDSFDQSQKEQLGWREQVNQTLTESRGLISALRESLEQRLLASDVALQLQTKELARRLEDLNHAHQKSIEDRREFLLKETFDISLKEVRSWREQVTITLAEHKGKSSTLAAIYAVAASLVVGLVVLVVGRMWK